MLAKNEHIDSYVIAFPIKEGAYAETYRVKDSKGKNYFLKLIDYSKLHHTQFTEDGQVLEVEIAKQLHHVNITSYHDSGKVQINGNYYAFIVFDHIVGETVAQKIERDQRCSVYDAKQIILGVLNGLKFLHGLDKPIIHNEITMQNVMLDLSSGLPVPKIIDFGYARYQNQSISSFMKEGLDPLCQATEALNGVYSIQSDLFSVGVMLFRLVFGMFPFYTDVKKYQNDRNAMIEAILEARRQPLRIPSIALKGLDEQLLCIMAKAMAMDKNQRFQTADEFIKAINGEISIGRIATNVGDSNTSNPLRRKTGNGFKDVAGMTALKEQLQFDVIDVLQDPVKAQEFGLSIPNGILFYGPPGCGKTFFAEKFAEEAGFNYLYIKCSDVASPYIHGGQGKIAEIFEEARKNAPTILFFDEIEAMIHDRSKQDNVSMAGEVNEFLAQLNNCGEHKVLVIGATNKPSEIDEAALRAGRLEYKYYIPLPDAETRAAIFEINLSQRKSDSAIDYEKLARLTENYISADIKKIVLDAARLAFRRKLEKITQELLEEVIANSKPSISMDIIRKHEKIRDAFEGGKRDDHLPSIGFKIEKEKVKVKEEESSDDDSGTVPKKMGF
ncbi:MAG: AAA family ATPase [Prevotella sp.]|nr:AAA family ATPase [Prevotella sp.]